MFLKFHCVSLKPCYVTASGDIYGWVMSINPINRTLFSFCGCKVFKVFKTYIKYNYFNIIYLIVDWAIFQ